MPIKVAVPAGRRERLAAAAGLLLITAVTAAGCSGSPAPAGGPGTVSSGAGAAASSGAGAATRPGFAGAAGPVATGPAAGSASSGSGSGSAAAALAPAGQQLIDTAELSLRASSVSAAVARATAVVTAAGGYVAAENASDGTGRPSQATATVTFKIPAAAYQATLASLSGAGLGTQLSLSQQAQDVTQQVADTSSRVASDEAAISQLRALLKRAGSISELLAVQDDINSQTSDLEAMQAQQNVLNRETSYATVTLTLVGPEAAARPKPQHAPPGLGGGLSRGWHAFAAVIGWLLTALGAAVPFLAAAAAVAGLGWGARRLVRRRG